MSCPYCGEPELFELFEVWEDGSFMIETCCEEAHEDALSELNADPVGEGLWADLDARLADYGWRRGYISEREERIRVDFGLRVGPISRKRAKAFVREHHRHNPPPAGDRFRFGCWNGTELIAVAIVGRPVARMIDHERVVEVNRLCVNHELDRELTWKACSALYLAAVDEARARGFEKVITYTLESESGMSLRYARFKAVAKTKGGSWDRPSRRRTDKAPTCPKIRWEKSVA